ncbi:zinc knuckle CX2CX4HX4C containing protein, partial [Tanacetum coccineum]
KCVATVELNATINEHFPSLSDAYGSPNYALLASKSHDIEKKMLEGKLVLLGDDGLPLKPSNVESIGGDYSEMHFPKETTTIEVGTVESIDFNAEINVSIESSKNKERETPTQLGFEDAMCGVKSSSYASIMNGEASSSKANFRFMKLNEIIEDANFLIPRSSIEEVNNRCAYTLYGYFIGKRVVFPVVQHFARTMWAKYGLKRILMNSQGFFFLKFSSKENLEYVLLDGPWMIRTVPIILKNWSTSVCLSKEHLKKIPMWVKLHDVPMATYTGDDFKEHLVAAIPFLKKNGYTRMIIGVEYEWTPPRCDLCKIFGHATTQCSKNATFPPKVAQNRDQNDGFTKVKRKGSNPKKFDGVSIANKFEYPPVVKPQKTNKASTSKVGTMEANSSRQPNNTKDNEMKTTNAFEVLSELDEPSASKDGNPTSTNSHVKSTTGIPKGTSMLGSEKQLSSLHSSSNVDSTKVNDLVNADSDSEVYEVYNETTNFMASGSGVGNKSLYELWKETYDIDQYDDDDFDDLFLTDSQLKFANAFDISLRGQLR